MLPILELNRIIMNFKTMGISYCNAAECTDFNGLANNRNKQSNNRYSHVEYISDVSSHLTLLINVFVCGQGWTLPVLNMGRPVYSYSLFDNASALYQALGPL